MYRVRLCCCAPCTTRACLQPAGTEFSVGDIAVGSYLLYLPLFFPDLDLTQYANVWSYMQRLAARPTCPAPYKEAMAGG